MKALVHDLTGQYIAFFNDERTAEDIEGWLHDQIHQNNKKIMCLFEKPDEAITVDICTTIKNGWTHVPYKEWIGMYNSRDAVSLDIVDIVPVI